MKVRPWCGQITLQHTWPCYAKSSYRSVDPQTLHGNVPQVDHLPNGPTYSTAITTMFPLRLCGGKPLVVVTRERCYGPSRLRINNDYDVWKTRRGPCCTTGWHEKMWNIYTLRKYLLSCGFICVDPRGFLTY